MIETIDTRRKRILHRARYRGFKEADMMVGGFAEMALGGMDGAGLDAFETLLDANDHDIYGWIVGAVAPPPEIDPGLIKAMRAFDASAAIRRS